MSNAVVCSGVRELQEALSATIIARDIKSRNARVAAIQKRWDRLRAGLESILDQRGADMADVPGGTSGLLVRDCKGKGSRFGWFPVATPAWSRWPPNCAAMSASPPRN
jgi:hypothetical protein